ncbi:uncharacterized protein F4812DRAFT_467665 [Daldinia caldariorum]|uniref:uncharacterized protein n=1 Tax=Daldinia caldariorum TaxID=326644 RepID=UPI0020086811|nr:uncharacterized protein F4812DRAFT_467665 [Daldinia caldariorum]KAI1471677.1 hypothetical protein F4812DRAFT_467665 [Daldinia caldariorum]
MDQSSALLPPQQPYARSGGRHPNPVCVLCRLRVSGHKSRCTRPMEGHGCTACKRYGLPCVFGGIALPTYPGPVKRQLGMATCNGCRELNVRCDMKRPCDRCHIAGKQCTGEFFHCFHRGVPGDDMYGYYLNLGFGPEGVNHVHSQQIFAWEVPYNYNLEYLEWERRKALNNQVVQKRLTQPVVKEYKQTGEHLRNAVNQGVPVDYDRILEDLTKDVNDNVPLNESQVARDLIYYLSKKSMSISSFEELPIQKSEFNILYNEADLQKLNPGSQSHYSYIAPLRNTASRPLTRPTSPGPARPQYWIPWATKSDDIPVYDNSLYFKPGSPERINLGAIRRNPFKSHPNENAESVLSTIPFRRMWDEGHMYSTRRPCQEENHTGKCNKDTDRGCEDTSHIGEGVPICDECEATNREKFYTEFTILALQMRQYLCHQCSNGNISIMDRLAGTGSKVHYIPHPGRPIPDFTSDSLVGTGLTEKVAVSDMRIYIDSVWGKQVCPMCKVNPGIHDYKFRGVVGGENCDKIWACLVCHSFVVTGDTTGLIPRKYTLSEQPADQQEAAPPPYGIRREERVKAEAELKQ